MNFLVVDIFGHYYNRYEHMTLEGFLIMCAFLLTLLLINRLLGKTKIKNSVFKNQNLSNYSLSFSPEENYSNITVTEKKVSIYVKVLAVIFTFVLIITPLAELIGPSYF